MASHVEGRSNTASGNYSHAEGNNNVSNAWASHSEGTGTIASGENQHVQGRYNISNSNYAHIVGGGESDQNRANIHTLDWQGNAVYAGGIKVNNNKDVATQEYVENYAQRNKEQRHEQ